MRRAARSAFLDAPAGSGYNAIVLVMLQLVSQMMACLSMVSLRQWADGVDRRPSAALLMQQLVVLIIGEQLDEWTGQFLQPGSQKAPEKAEPQVPSDVVMQKAAADFKDFFMKNKV